MRKFGLIGFPLTHSFSKTYFAEKFYRDGIDDCIYESFPIENINQFKDLIASEKNLNGLNVTIPYKVEIIPYLDEISDKASAIGSVNCIEFSNGKLIGHNTDYTGFLKSLQPFIRPHHRNALVLGTGGSAKTVCFVLKQFGIDITLVSRSKSMNSICYEDLDKTIILRNTIIVNTTPIGMFPNTAASPNIPYEFIGSQHLMYDLIYNPELTVFLLKGREQNAVSKNGLEMLQIQAEESWDIWNKEK